VEAGERADVHERRADEGGHVYGRIEGDGGGGHAGEWERSEG